MKLYPILLLLSLSSLFIFSLYNSSSLSLSKPDFQNPSFQPSPKFTFTIKLLTYDRLPSLSRCLQSLAAAHYDGEKVNIHIFIDHFQALDQNNDEFLDKKLNQSKDILVFVDEFEWRFGEKIVHYRTKNVGLQAQWLEEWWPVSDDDFAFVVEDDIELSPLYYRFLKGLIVEYYYDASNYTMGIYGASLQRPRFVPGKHGNKIHLPEETQVFLYQLVGTWGQLLFPKPWKEFRLWYDTHKTKNMKPILDGMVTTGWYKKMGDRIWTPWFIKFIHARGYYNLYTNFLHESSLSVSHRDAGVNYGKTAGPDSNLIQEGSRESSFSKLVPLKNLKWYDFCFREVFPNRNVKTVDELEHVLKSVQNANSLLILSIDPRSEIFIRNLICHFERINVRNYIFMGPESDFLLDLSRRGHPVINADRFFETMKQYKSIKFGKEIIVNAYVIKKALEMKYDTWVLDHNILPVKSDLILDSIKTDSTVDFFVKKKLGLLFAKSSGSGVWTDHFVNDIARMVNAKTRKDESRFVFLASNLLETKGVKLKTADNDEFSVEIGDENATSLKNDTKFVFWSSDMGSDLLQNRLERLGLWIIDTEANCKAVICHPS